MYSNTTTTQTIIKVTSAISNDIDLFDISKSTANIAVVHKVLCFMISYAQTQPTNGDIGIMIILRTFYNI